MWTPNGTNAESAFNVEILTAEKTKGPAQGTDQICIDWNLTKEEVKQFFETAKPLAFYEEINSFEFFNCYIRGKLISEGVTWKYLINPGGYASWYVSDKEINFGCREGECLKYVHYEAYSDDE